MKLISIWLSLHSVVECLHLPQEHEEWDNSMSTLSHISDVLWNYCDLKCLYLETYFDYDFVALIFSRR